MIIGIPFFMKSTNIFIRSDNIKAIIKANHIFNDLTLALKLRVIKIFPKSNIAVIWIDVQNTQSGSNSKMLINRCFNIERHISTIQGANMNPDIPQCKTYQKWSHTMRFCRIQDFKCVKYNRLHKLEHYYQFEQYCKTNYKINLL